MAGSLSSYQQQTQRLLNDPLGVDFNLQDLTVYINMARQQVAAEGQCVRFLTPITGGVLTAPVLTSGSGYTSLPTVTVSPPDTTGTTAVLTPQLIGGMLSNLSVSVQGSGYLFPPAVTISGGGGSGATATTTLTYTVQAVPNQEVYSFQSIPQSSMPPGVGSILTVRSVAWIWTNWRYAGTYLGFSKFQARVRNFTVGSYSESPFYWSSFGQGTAGSFYIYPPPDQTYPMELDCIGLPIDLADDTAPDAIPAPWTLAVPFYAAYLALLGKSLEKPYLSVLADKYYNLKDGGLFRDQLRRARVESQPSVNEGVYGRPLR